MKKCLRFLLAFCLCLGLYCPAAASASPAKEPTPAHEQFYRSAARTINKCSNALMSSVAKALDLLIPAAPGLQDYKTFDLESYRDFFPGMQTFLDAPAAGSRWQLGYSKQSIVPDNFGQKAYYRGGDFFYLNAAYECKDDLCVRTVVLDDGSGRGLVVFAILDAVGISNADVRLIRHELADFARKNNIVSINIGVTHTHTGIDLQGAWNHVIGNTLYNTLIAPLHPQSMRHGVDREYLECVVAQTVQSVHAAVADLKPGTLTFAAKDAPEYAWDRTAPNCYDSTLYRLCFMPDDRTARPTILASMGVHPENSVFNQREENGKPFLTADMIAYTDALLDKAGYNYVFLQGCIGTVTMGTGNSTDGLDLNRYPRSVRYGQEFGFLLLGMTRTQAQCAALNEQLGDPLGVREGAHNPQYTVWYDNWQPVEEQEVEPLLNIAHTQYILPVDSALMMLVGKAGVTDYLFLRDKKAGKYYTVTESGYLELGTMIKAAISPGETYGELLLGGEGLEGFAYPALRACVDENLIVLDLMNDAVGYLQPDPNYVMLGVAYNPEDDAAGKFPLEHNTWGATSFGAQAASTIVGAFLDLVQSCRGAAESP